MAATGVVLGLLAGSRRRLSNALPYLVVLAIVLGTGWQFYANPPVFLYNVLIGYFPGNLYDEDITLGAPLVWSRLYQLATVREHESLCGFWCRWRYAVDEMAEDDGFATAGCEGEA